MRLEVIFAVLSVILVRVFVLSVTDETATKLSKIIRS